VHSVNRYATAKQQPQVSVGHLNQVDIIGNNGIKFMLMDMCVMAVRLVNLA